MIRHHFTSEDKLYPGAQDNDLWRIEVVSHDGPFRFLTNEWRFTPVSGGCLVFFEIRFQLSSVAFQHLFRSFFSHVAYRMVHAFEERAAQLYGCDVAV